MPRGSRALGASGGSTGSRHPRASVSLVLRNALSVCAAWAWGPGHGLAKCLQGAGGEALGGRAEPYPDSREEPPRGRHQGVRKGGWRRVHMCAHTGMHSGAHVHTLSCQGVHTCMHTTNTSGSGPRGGGGGAEALRARGLSRAQARRQWRRSCPWWARRCRRGSTGPRCPGASWS